MIVSIKNVDSGQKKKMEDITLYKLFNQSVKTHPDKVALFFGKEQMTYQQLSNMSDCIAIRLSEQFESGTRFAFCVDRCFLQIAGLLAILKTGNICVPISSGYPVERIENICRQMECNVIIHDETLQTSKFPPKYCFLKIDELARETDDSVRNYVTEKYTDNSFVVFTSGSTGEPKGVWSGQKAMINSLLWRSELCGITAKDVFLYKAPITFDISLWEIFLPLITGASLVIANPMGHYLVPYLITTIVKRKISVVQFIGTVLRKFIEDDNSKFCSSLRVIFCGGEHWDFELGNRVQNKLPNVSLFNVYGQSETSLGSSGWRYSKDYDAKCLTIGRPNYNTDYLIISDGCAVEIGNCKAGELYVGGSQLSKGYVNNEKETNDKFVNIILKETGEKKRFYKTGDIVRRLADGNYTYVGRKDNQVKISGVRIELEEIENLCNKVLGIAGSVALKIDKKEESFVALFVKRSGTSSGNEKTEIMKICREHLTSVMVPQKIIFLDEIPITGNGKMDRGKLMEEYFSPNKTDDF